MNQLLEKLKKWNEQMNGLPRIACLVAVTLFCTWLFLIIAPYMLAVYPCVSAFPPAGAAGAVSA